MLCGRGRSQGAEDSPRHLLGRGTLADRRTRAQGCVHVYDFLSSAGVRLGEGQEKAIVFAALTGVPAQDIRAAWVMHAFHALRRDERVRLQKRGVGQICALSRGGRRARVDAFWFAHNPLGRRQQRSRTVAQKEHEKFLVQARRESR